MTPTCETQSENATMSTSNEVGVELVPVENLIVISMGPLKCKTFLRAGKVHDPTTGEIHIPEDQLGLVGNFDKHASISTAAAPIVKVVLRHSFKTHDF